MAKVLASRCSCSASPSSALSSSTYARGDDARDPRASKGAKFAVLRSLGTGEGGSSLSSSLGLPRLRRRRRRKAQVTAALEEISQNHVLVSASFAGILGQVIKPFTSAALGKGFNWKLVIKPGGLPSTHSAVVTAAATALGLDRGLSDSVFGFSVIVAAVVMYDAQGVRRSVGKQAEVINTMVLSQMANINSVPPLPMSTSTPNPSPYAIGVELARDPVQAELAFMGEADSSSSLSKASKSTAVLNESMDALLRVNGTPSRSTATPEEPSQLNVAPSRPQEFFDVAEKLPSVKDGQVTLQEIGTLSGWRHIPLKESVGHTKVEVFVGALWGIVVAIGFHSVLQL